MLGELAVVGGGVVGLTCALAAVDSGWRVTVFDAGPDRRASDVAGGMLGCLAEGHPGEDRLLAISRESTSLWPGLLNRLSCPDILTATDSLLVGATPSDVAALETQMRFLRSELPDDTHRIPSASARELRTLEPALARNVAGGFQAVGEGAVDNRKLLAALRAALDAAGVMQVRAEIDNLADVPGEQILVAAGLDTRRLLPDVDLRGEKGEILRLRRTRWSVAPPRNVIRARWHGRPVYLVPREDGIVLGATQYEAYDDTDRAPLAGGVADLLGDADELMPGLRTYELTEVSAGIRPSSADGVPLIERVDERVTVAAGHGRNGIALAPWTAQQVLPVLAQHSTHTSTEDRGVHHGIDRER
ncbi:FAD-dependent oxidoreductase [Gordonia sp. (in: high G+C Gram-positive bacteria)]|uniref:FAD-dependent oxidoreductase n=1 Tax=Gordonia sp. (in: high G+C Gram-positive bacteria) TaxID=84139 RepID=UPI003C73D13F